MSTFDASREVQAFYVAVGRGGEVESLLEEAGISYFSFYEPGPVTEAQVEAALDAYFSTLGSQEKVMRAAIEAAMERR